MCVAVKRKHRFRAYPSPSQEVGMANLFGCCRSVYNWALGQREKAFKETGKGLSYGQTSKLLTALKKEDREWLKEVSSVPLQQSLRHLDHAYQRFFKKLGGYPSFKSKYGKQSATFTDAAFKFDPVNKNLSLAKIGRIKVKWSREISDITTVTLTKEKSGKYFVTVQVEEEIEQLPRTGKEVGVDVGISHLATLSDGRKIDNPRTTLKWEKRLARAQRILSRRKKGSNRRRKQKIKVARLHEKISNIRKDFLDKATTTLVREFDVIAIEDLHVKGMVRNRKLAKHISDASFGTLRRMLEYKAEWYGKEVRVCGRFFASSKTCSDCGFKVDTLPLNVRSWECPQCRNLHDRDVNAAKNILAVGQTVTARGADVRPVSAYAGKGKLPRSENQPVRYVLHV